MDYGAFFFFGSKIRLDYGAFFLDYGAFYVHNNAVFIFFMVKSVCSFKKDAKQTKLDNSNTLCSFKIAQSKLNCTNV